MNYQKRNEYQRRNGEPTYTFECGFMESDENEMIEHMKECDEVEIADRYK